jgi:asparagine synthase (glutamine-hydrolysing)
MCGIVGHVGKTQLDLAAGTAALQHRGPDDEGHYRDARGDVVCDLGFRRLAIIDLSPDGHQPMGNEDGQIQLVFNGEIYNHGSLREELKARGHVFRSRTDTEVIVHGYEEWGDGVLQRLRGMFAIGLWDLKRQRLLVARDRLGIKPLFVSEQDGRILFASEMKALLALGVSRELEPRALSQYLRYLHLLPPLTFFRRIRRLAAGEKLVWEKGQTTISTYWDLSLPPAHRDETLIVAQLREMLDDVIRDHLQADVPLGVFLSGGLDSSTIAAMMARHSKTKVRSFCMTFGEGEGLYDERDHARRVADYLGLQHTEVPVQPQIAALLPEMVRGFDEPFGNPTALLTWLLSREVRKEVTVALAGDGGDEVFLGYPRYLGARLSNTYRLLPGGVRKGLDRFVAPLIQESSSGQHWPRRVREFISTGSMSPEAMYESWVSYFSPAEIGALIGARAANETPSPLATAFQHAPGGNIVDRASYVDLKTFLPANLLVYTDRMSMAHSLEVRVPFCDHRLVEFMSSISADQRMSLTQSKRLMRLAMKGALPEETLTRGKLGFNPPMGIWLKNQLRPLVDELLEPKRLAREGFFDPREVERLVNDQRNGQRDVALQVWSLLVFQSWQTLYKPEPS